MDWLYILAFTLASSLDNLGVGICYGIRSIQIRSAANTLIALICFGLSYTGIVFGNWISAILPGTLITLGSVCILMIIGLRIIFLSFSSECMPEQTSAESKSESKLGLANILKNPECVDFDQSHSIGLVEAAVLGVALAANAATNGVTAGLLGFSPLIISIAAAVGSFLTIWLGVKIGSKAAHIRIGSLSLGQCGTFLSGVMLILIALGNLLP